jgi:hypothetical protein
MPYRGDFHRVLVFGCFLAAVKMQMQNRRPGWQSSGISTGIRFYQPLR